MARVDDLPALGRHVRLEPSPDLLAALAKPAGVEAVERLVAAFDLTPRGTGVHIGGRVTATVRQTCGITLEPMRNEIDEAVDVDYAPARAAPGDVAGEDEPEPLTGNSIDLALLATEFLILGVDPYPRKADAAFDPPAADEPAHPFAALAGWNKKGAVKE